MQIVLDKDECWSLMTIITSYAIDNAGVSQDAKTQLRKWRTEHADGTPAMGELSDAMNDALGEYLGFKQSRSVRKKGGVQTRKEPRK
jgi:hypothetical protein